MAIDFKAEAYQTLPIMEQTAANLQAVASKIFLSDRQMANQVAATITHYGRQLFFRRFNAVQIFLFDIQTGPNEHF